MQTPSGESACERWESPDERRNPPTPVTFQDLPAGEVAAFCQDNVGLSKSGEVIYLVSLA